MTRCPQCSRPCTDKDLFCRHCGERLQKIRQKFWRLQDWLMGEHALYSLAAAAAVFAVRVLVHSFLMPYEGARVEGRLVIFHLSLGLAFGLALPAMRRNFSRWHLWLLAGLLGGGLDWALDYAYMADHIISQAVFYVLNWIDPSPDSNSIMIGFGILQTLRYTGIVLIFSLATLWKAPRGIQTRVVLFALLALSLRFPVKGYALSSGLFRLFWHQSALYFSSLFALFYGLGPLDSNSAK